jgi:hypothetical protein
MSFINLIFYVHFSRPFAKLRKWFISFVMSVCTSVRPSIRVQNLCSHLAHSHEIWQGSIFGKDVEKFQVSWISYKTSGIYIKINIHCFIISHWIIFRMRNMPEKVCKENQNTFFMFKHIFFENRALYEIMWKIMVEPDRPHVTYDIANAHCLLNN